LKDHLTTLLPASLIAINLSLQSLDRHTQVIDQIHVQGEPFGTRPERAILGKEEDSQV
jgi:hypothetical protein